MSCKRIHHRLCAARCGALSLLASVAGTIVCVLALADNQWVATSQPHENGKVNGQTRYFPMKHNVTTTRKLVVFTALFENVGDLRKQPQEAGVEYICFTDRKEYASSGTYRVEGWRIIYIDGLRILDGEMMKKHVKVFPFLYLNARTTESLYIDGSAALRAQPSAVFNYLLPPEQKYNFGHCLHPKGRQTWVDQVLASADIVKDKTRHFAQKEAYESKNVSLDEWKGLWSDFALARRHSPEMQEFSELWWRELLEFSEIDQVGLARALHEDSVCQRRCRVHPRGMPCDDGKYIVGEEYRTRYTVPRRQKARSVPLSNTLALGDSGVSTVLVLSMISLKFDGEMILPFVSYYKDVLAILPDNFHIFLQYDPRYEVAQCREYKALLAERGINAIPYPYRYSSPSRQKFYLILLDMLGPNYWILHADADEFHSFPPLAEANKLNAVANLTEHWKLKQLVWKMESRAHNHFRTKWEDRIGAGRKLLNVLPRSNASALFSRYPCSMPRDGLQGIDFKVALYRSYLRPASSGHHKVRYMRNKAISRSRISRHERYPTEGVTFHFKWRASVKKKLQERRTKYKEMGLNIWRESQHNLQTLEKSLAKHECATPRYSVADLATFYHVSL